MSAEEVELLAAYWTLAGETEPIQPGGAAGREWSLFDIRDRCEAAARAGFRGISFWHADLEHVLETRSLSDLKEIVDGVGFEYIQLEFLMDWFLDEADERRRASDRTRRLLFEAADVLQPFSIKVGNIPATPCPLPQLTEKFAELCAEAAEHGTAVAYELIPFDPNVNSLDTLLAVVEGADAPNGGVSLDTWHLVKLEIPPHELRRIPPRFLTYVELMDGYVKSDLDPAVEVVDHRKLCGEGEFDLPGYIAVLRELGYAGPWGVEVLSAELRKLPLEEAARRAYETTIAQFAEPASL